MLLLKLERRCKSEFYECITVRYVHLILLSAIIPMALFVSLEFNNSSKYMHSFDLIQLRM